jgi:capsular exopolysaccharide synthesis family protein
VNAADAETPDLWDYVRLLRRRGWILLLCVILIPVAVYVYTDGRPKIFQASTTLQLQAGGVDGSLLSTPDFSAPAANIQAVASFVSTTAVADEAARQLGVPAGSLFGAAQATPNEDTGFIVITGTGATAKRATDVANAFAAALNATRKKRGQSSVDAAIQKVQADLQGTPKSDSVTRNQLNLQLNRLQTLRQAQAQNAQVLQPALGASQIAPHPRRNATVAVILALLIGVALIALVERLDRRLRKPEDLEQLTGLPFLATIPHAAFPGEDSHPEVPEAFQTLRNSLTYFNADQPLTSLVVTSGLKGEGKTTVAANLAIAFASFGKRVIIVDTDLRKPDLASRMGFDDSIGLSQVLAGTITLDAALRDVEPFGHGLRLLPAGPVPPNPSALLGSLRMASLIDELGADADMVILDTAPVLIVSDAFPLLDRVSGVIALARLDKSPRETIRRMVHILGSVGARVLGLVATDGKRSTTPGYGYGYGYGADRAASNTVPWPAAEESESGAASEDGPAATIPAENGAAVPPASDRGRLFRKI